MSRLKVTWKNKTIFLLIRCRVDSNWNDDEYFFFSRSCLLFCRGNARVWTGTTSAAALRCTADLMNINHTEHTPNTHRAPPNTTRWEGNSKYSSSPVPRISIFTSCGRGSASVEFLSEGTFFCRVVFIPLLFSPSFDTTPWRTYLSRSHLTGRGKHTKTFRLYSA